MTDLDSIQKMLNHPEASPSPHDQSIHSQIDSIISCIEHEKIHEAVKIIEKIFTKGLLDIRLVAYYAYSHFFNNGIKSLAEIFPLLTRIVNQHWEQIKPLNRKDKQVQNSLNWLILHLITKMKQVEKLSKKGEFHPIWTLSTEAIIVEDLEQVIQCIHDFKELFHEKWPKSPAEERLMHLLQMTKDIQTLITHEETVTEEQPSETVSVKEEPEQVHEDLEEGQAVSDSDTTSEALDNDSQYALDEVMDQESNSYFGNSLVENRSPQQQLQVSYEADDASEDDSTPTMKIPPATSQWVDEIQKDLFSSEKMRSVFEKLRVFELLIKHNDHLKAALVAKDIDDLIENFDPSTYFPKLFSNYFSLVARNIDALSKHWGDKQSDQSKYLEKLYQSDLEHFINW